MSHRYKHEAQHDSPAALNFTGHEQVTSPTRGDDPPKIRPQREMYCISSLNTTTPAGLNDDFSLRCLFSRQAAEYLKLEKT